MKRRRFSSYLLCVCTAVLLLTGCSGTGRMDANHSPPSVSTDSPTPSPTDAAEPPVSTGSPTPPPADTSEPPGQLQTATLYIGTKESGFTEYPLDYEGELTPEVLIQGIADLTGWDLTLAEEVISGKGGMSVCLADTSSLFVGPPDPQKDEFHMFDAEQLAETILDSIQKTLQEGFTGEGGDPEALDIWYYMEGELPLELPNIGRSWPIDQPYQWQ